MVHVAVHIRGPVVPTRISVGELFVIESKQMEDGGVKIMHIHRPFSGKSSEVVRGSVGEAWLCPAPGHPDREAPGVVVAPDALLFSNIIIV
jgi:hypothetical protein